MSKAPDNKPLPKLTDVARKKVKARISDARLIGEREEAAILEMLLVLHDRVHGLEDKS